MRLSVHEISSGDELEAIRPAWADLWDRCPDATPFQSPEWLLPWRRHLFRGGRLWVLALCCGERLAGLAPLFVYGNETRRVALLGAGITDYVDVLLEPEIAAEGEARILAHIRQDRGWDECEWADLNPSSPLPRCAGAAWECSGDAPCPVLRLPERFEQVISALPAKFRTDWRRAQNRLARAGNARLERACPHEVPEYMEALFRLHAAAWRARQQPGVLAASELQAFHREAASGLMARGHLRLWGLRLDGALAAVIYGFAARGRAYAYLGGFDPALGKLSLGTVLMGHAIQQSLEEGVGEFHFLRGREEYKYAWGARDRMSVRLRLRRA